MRRRSPVQLAVKHERWLVSYSDFVTLLFAFFVVMYSISQVSEDKYRVLSSTLLEAFNVNQSAINPIQVGEPTLVVAPTAIEIPEKAKQEQEDTTSNTNEDNNLQQLEQVVTEQFVDLIDDKLLKVNSNELWLELELNSNILFPTGSADPSLQAKGIFEDVADLFSGYGNPVQVEGFTDNIPINNRRFKSNWELSAARAASVVKLLARNGVSPERLSAVGRGEFQPVADNATPEGRAQNRRVVVMISKAGVQRPQVSSETAEEIVGTPPSENVIDDQPTENDGILLETVEQGQPVEQSPNNFSEPVIEPVELNNGGLLFTSDPDLPRNNLPLDSAPVDKPVQIREQQ